MSFVSMMILLELKMSATRSSSQCSLPKFFACMFLFKLICRPVPVFPLTSSTNGYLNFKTVVMHPSSEGRTLCFQLPLYKAETKLAWNLRQRYWTRRNLYGSCLLLYLKCCCLNALATLSGGSELLRIVHSCDSCWRVTSELDGYVKVIFGNVLMDILFSCSCALTVTWLKLRGLLSFLFSCGI